MKFNVNYEVTNVVEEMIKKREIFCYTANYYKKIYIYKDVRDFGIIRIKKNGEADVKYKENQYTIERNLIDKYHFIDFYNEKYNADSDWYSYTRQQLNQTIDSLPVEDIIRTLIIMDDEKALENWDSANAATFEGAIRIATYDQDVIYLEA